MSDDIILQVNNLSKCFKIYPNPWHRAREWLSLGNNTYHQPFWSLKDVSFTVRKGDFFGIIGENGAGKSTLLKIITGVLKPTSGSYQLNGKVLSLLELGTDFNPELSGRGNAIYSAELLGFPKGYVQERIKEIEDFSELGDFFDRPMKLYSSGMKTRLAFSLFAFLECDVLILDEVLAVGDIFFQQKCYARLEELIARQITIILVTHHLASVQQYCKEVIVLHHGEKIFQGESMKGIIKFHQLKMGLVNNVSPPVLQEKVEVPLETPDDFFWPADEVFIPVSFPQANYAQLISYAICNVKGEGCVNFLQGEQAYLCCEFKLKESIAVPIVAVFITNKFNVRVHVKTSFQHKISVPNQVNKGDYVRFCRSINLNIAPDEYVLGFGLATMNPNNYARLDELPQTEFNSHIQICDLYEKVGVFYVKSHYSNNHHSHFGLCNLPGKGQIQVITSSK
ncbi:polysaccharide/polyol phosphate ABC transporter ATP-binding protein [Nostoc punctiforme NIES-2108]|uniref:Polysaccharide/polyol phosphate ABC transporter ATP-binding protein n=1 Tax=Nostoc punctiforme NIES-2108 TaxID=1356359 RepID=A0A367R9F4_NOSPU|nr:polysaccharide/polyol phosphate ABC transporter ATP-binding protein [Nostoc punctiforme NIES-2108]